MPPALVVLAALVAACCSCRSPDRGDGGRPGRQRTTEVVLLTGDGGRVEVQAEVVATEASRRKGLMFRSEVPEGTGMLFVFPEEAEHPFWMKNTHVSLDMIFIDGRKDVVGILRDTKPLSEASLTVGVPSRYVLEVPAGFCARHGVHRGDRAEWE